MLTSSSQRANRQYKHVRAAAFLVATLTALTACTAPNAPTATTSAEIDYETATITQLAKAYVDRIKEVNSAGPGLRAIQAIDPSWRDQAKEADKRRAAGESRGALDGIPVIVKDNIDVKGMATTAGSLALADNSAQSDATVTTNLRNAGAVILAKATMVEFAFWNSGTSWGYSSLGGQPLNPYDASYETSGSSSGSGVAAAAGLAAITIGTDTGGSVVTPAEKMSLVGYRPTTGLISRHGIVPITTFSDTAGVMGKTVEDVAIGVKAIAGVDSADEATAAAAPYQDTDYAGTLSDTSLQGKRIGVVTPVKHTADEQLLWEKAVSSLTDQGATVVPVDMKMTDFPFTATTYEFRRNLDQYLKDRTAADFPIKSVAELADYYRGHPAETQKYGASTLFSAEKVDLDADLAAHDADLAAAQSSARSTVDGFLAELSLDAFRFSETSTVQFQAAIGSYPEVAVPAGYLRVDRHPFSVVFMGKQWDDANLLSYAHDYEQATKLRQTPSAINPSMWRCVGSVVPKDSPLCLP
jgi:amidase